VLELTKDPDARQVFQFLNSNDDVGRSLFTTPNVPPDRLVLLRAAFDKLLIDRDFLADAERLKLPLAAKSGDEVENIVRGTFDIAPTALANVLELSKPESK
jgi:hypothetical protein